MSAFDTAITMKLVNEIITKLTPLLNLGKKIPQIVRMKPDPDKFTFTELKRATSTSSKFPDDDSPSIDIANPLDRDTSVKAISLAPDAGFKTNGIVRIFIDEVAVFKSDTVASFTDITDNTITFNEGKRIKQKRSVKIFIKNDDNSTSISLAAQVRFGD